MSVRNHVVTHGPYLWESAKVSLKRVFALLTFEIHSYEIAQMLQKPVFALPGCQRMSVDTSCVEISLWWHRIQKPLEPGNTGKIWKNYKIPHSGLGPENTNKNKKNYENGQKMAIFVIFLYFFCIFGPQPVPFLVFLEKGQENHQKNKDFLSLLNP